MASAARVQLPYALTRQLFVGRRRGYRGRNDLGLEVERDDEERRVRVQRVDG